MNAKHNITIGQLHEANKAIGNAAQVLGECSDTDKVSHAARLLVEQAQLHIDIVKKRLGDWP